jgi:hypothetical protein
MVEYGRFENTFRRTAGDGYDFAADTAATTANRFDRARRPQLLFRNPRVFQQKSLHIGDDEAWVERSRTVDIPDATFPID